MYCFDAYRCTQEDCPVRRKRFRRCWTYWESIGKTPTEADCPYGPCVNCHYRMGWEIGLIGDSLFSEDPGPDGAGVVPDQEPAEPAPPPEGPLPLPPPPAAPEPPPPATPSHPRPDPEQTPEKAQVAPNDRAAPVSLAAEGLTGAPAKPEAEPEPVPEGVGASGMRFCWEVVGCENLSCPVRQRRIIRCFKYFEPRGDEGKLAVTGGERVCDRCHYKRGWDIGLITEEMFEDVLAERRQKMARVERIRQEGLVDIYLRELSKKPLSREQEIDLARKIAGDRQASELFLTANLKLVVRIARQYSNRGLNLLDLIQEGNLGLIKAISKFDYTLGYKFSTYAAYWVRNYMQKAVSEQGRTIRVPHHLLVVAHKIKRTIHEQQTILGRPPSLAELAQMLNLEEEKVLQIIRITETPISIEARPMGDDGEEENTDYFLTDRNALTPEEEALERSKGEACRKALDLLPERLRGVVEKFYGFAGESQSLAEIGREMGLTRERARQLLKEALQILEKQEFVIQLKDYLG